MSGKHYNIAHLGVGPFRQGQVIPEARFPQGTQFDRLLRIGAICEVDVPQTVDTVKSVRSAHRTSAGITDAKGSDRPDIASRTDVQVISPEEREELVAEYEAQQASDEDVETIEDDTPTAEETTADDGTPAEEVGEAEAEVPAPAPKTAVASARTRRRTPTA